MTDSPEHPEVIPEWDDEVPVDVEAEAVDADAAHDGDLLGWDPDAFAEEES